MADDTTKPDPKRAAQLAMGQAPKADTKPAPKAPEPVVEEKTDAEEA